MDRDGTIIENLPFPNVNEPAKVRLLPGAAEGVRQLNDMGCRVIVVTNQAGISNPENDLTYERYQAVSERMRALIEERAGGRIDDEFCCPHARDANCPCRKPRTGLFLQSMQRYPDIRPDRSFVVGDRADDILAGKALGARTVLVRTGHGPATAEELAGTPNAPDWVVEDLLQGARVIGDARDTHKLL
ncbi:MAG: HAD-IIIA family hydrolase [Kiritimatiellae bacterium]|nr:HAD-IIIA family hydrolase [Kiritimatiellia bacterium]